MTIRLLSTFDGCPPNSIITLDAANEAGMVTAKTASFDLTGGTPFVPKVGPLEVITGSFTVRARRARLVALPEGKALKVVGNAGAAGEVTRVDSLDKWTVGASALAPITGYSGTQKILISCTAGSIDAVVGDAVLGAASITPGSQVISDSLGNQLPVARAVNPANFNRARKALANVKMGIGNMRVALIGDSTVVGRGAVVDNSYAGARAFSQAEQLAKYLTKAGISANANSFFGTGVFAANSAQYAAYDPRVSWTGYVPTGAYCMGGNMLLATAAGSFTFQPAAGVNITDYEVYYVDFGATTSTDIGGAGTATLPNTNSGTLKKATVSKAASNDPFHANWLAGNSYIAGVIGTNSAAPEVTIVSMGGSGWGANTVPGWASSFAAYSPITSLKLYAPDLTIIRAGINDGVTGVDLALFSVNMTTLINAAKLSGDVIIEVSPYTGATLTQEKIAVRNALQKLAAANNCGFNDNTQRWADEATMEALGFFNADKTHIFRVGLSDLATSSFNMFMSM